MALFYSFLNNIATMLAVVIVYNFASKSLKDEKITTKIISGFVFSIAVFITMHNDFVLADGVVFDARSVIISVCGMFAGPIAVFMTSITAIVYRIWTGGGGTFMGICVIISSALIGLLFYYLRKSRPQLTNAVNLYIFGFIVHINMLFWVLTLPRETIINAYKTITLPVLLILPLGSLCFGKLLGNQEEQIKIANELIEKEKLLRETGEIAKIGAWEFDVETRQNKWTDEVFRIHDLNPGQENAVEISLSRYSKESREKIETAMKEAIEFNKAYDFELEITTAKGINKWVRILGTPVFENNKVIKVLGSFQDITERNRATEELLLKTTLLEAQSEETIDGILVVDDYGKVILFNKHFGNMWNIPQQLIGAKNDERMLQYVFEQLKDSEGFLKKVKYLYANKDEKSRDEIQLKDGRVFDRYSSPMTDSNGVHRGRIWYFRDITDRKKAEESLKQAKTQAEAANEAKSHFLANMSHEMRTPLNAIIGFSEILMQEEFAKEHKEHLRMIYNSGGHLLGLVNDILNISSIEAGKMNIKMNQCSLRELIANIESMMQPFAAGKGLTFEIHEKGDLPANIVTDAVRLQQCLINLVNNAIKFTEQGHIYVNISLEDKDSKPFIRFEVEDTGIGIATESQQKIFEPFFQEDGGTSRKYGGTGLGLAIARKFAGLLGGELTLTSEKGKGSVFSFIIPAGVDLAAQPLLDRRKIIDDAGKVKQDRFSGCILVAEDVKTNQMLMKFLLEKMGFKVTIAENGAEAVNKALGQKFDLIFMDIQMPVLNGYEAARTLRSKGIKIPIVALTAGTMEGDEEKCIEAGCDVYLSKPVVISKLIETLSKYLPSEKQVLVEAASSAFSKVE